jgi:transposase
LLLVDGAATLAAHGTASAPRQRKQTHRVDQRTSAHGWGFLAVSAATRACLTALIGRFARSSGTCQGGWVVRRHELTDQAWAEIAPLLPANGRPGGQWADHRRTVNGILWKLATGVPWRDLPERYGPWQTCYERFRPLAGRWDLAAVVGPRPDQVSCPGSRRVPRVSHAHRRDRCLAPAQLTARMGEECTRRRPLSALRFLWVVAPVNRSSAHVVPTPKGLPSRSQRVSGYERTTTQADSPSCTDGFQVWTRQPCRCRIAWMRRSAGAWGSCWR